MSEQTQPISSSPIHRVVVALDASPYSRAVLRTAARIAVGEPDEMSGELVKIVVVPKDPALAETDLIDHCRKHLTAYKVPKIVEFRSDPLPKTNIGKILRRELRRKI